MEYRESVTAANPQRCDYLRSIQDFIGERRVLLSEERRVRAAEIAAHPETARKAFAEMLGYPLTEEPHVPLSVESTPVTSERGVTVCRLKLEIFKGFFFYGLFFQRQGKKQPLVVVQHGGEGTPELCSGFFEGGSANYNDMTERVLQKDVAVFAPQLLLWNKGWYGIDYDRVKLDAQLKQVGSSITALEIYGIRCAISYFRTLPTVDADRIGMVGLSYGGFYTLFTAALDTRIRAALSCGFFNNRYEYSWTDWTFFNAARRFLDSEIALLCYPRKLCIAVGDEDYAFNIAYARQEHQRLLAEIRQCGLDDGWFSWQEFPGSHEFPTDGVLLDTVIRELKQA